MAVTDISSISFRDNQFNLKDPSKYEKPAGGIPYSDLENSVKASLDKADSALHEHQSLAAYRPSTAQDAIDATKLSLANKGVPGGVAELDGNGKVPVAQCPIEEDVAQATTDWLDTHIAQETGYVIDDSLTVAGAAADAKAVGVLKSAVYEEKPLNVWTAGYRWAGSNGRGSANSKYIYSKKYFPTNYATSAISVRALPGYLFVLSCWDMTGTYVGMWNGSGFQKTTTVKHSYVRLADVGTGYQFALSVCAENVDVDLTVDAGANIIFNLSSISESSSKISSINNELAKHRIITNKTSLFEAQQAIASDWHFPFINVYDALGLGNNHRIPGTAKIWQESNTNDLTQKKVWMSDGTHPYRGVGLVEMYGRTIANQLALISPSYHDGAGLTTPSYWAGKTFLWLGTSIPAGSDPDFGSGTGATYPTLVANQLNASVTNIARGSSMLRINSSSGLYENIPFSHYARAITRTIGECDEILANWASIYPLVPGNPPADLQSPTDYYTVMKNQSFENLIVPYLNGEKSAPDLWVIDYGHNDTAYGIDGELDFWVQPTQENIEKGVLAADEYMTRNNYANLKHAFNDNDLSGIPDIATFAASVNRNCFQGAFNFLITLILTYSPYARICVISDYN